MASLSRPWKPTRLREDEGESESDVKEDGAFDGCKRIKTCSTDTSVVLLIHHPLRNRVTHAFLPKADAILGLPCNEPQLSQKLTAVLQAHLALRDEE